MKASSDCKNCKNKDATLFNSLETIIWYDGHYVWLKELRDDMEKHDGHTYGNPFDTKNWHTEHHTIWMLLVGMFGNWGTSIRGGWIDDIPGCIAFIDAVCHDSWEAEARE